MTASLTLPAAITLALETALDGVQTHAPGRVTRVSADGSSVDVQPLVRTRYVDETGAEVTESYPVIPNVPVMHPSGGDYAVTFPVAVGDTVLLAWSKDNLDRWKATGGEVDPGDYSRHGLADAVAILGLRSYAEKLASAPNDRITIGSRAGIQVHVTSTEVQLGGTAATQAAVNGTTYRSAEDTLFSAIAAALSSAGFPIAGALATFNASAASYLSTAVKVKP